VLLPLPWYAPAPAARPGRGKKTETLMPLIDADDAEVLSLEAGVAQGV